MLKAKKALKVRTMEPVWRAADAGSNSELFNSTYDLKLPAATVGCKRPATYWLERDAAAAASKTKKAERAAEQAVELQEATEDAKTAARNRLIRTCDAFEAGRRQAGVSYAKHKALYDAVDKANIAKLKRRTLQKSLLVARLKRRQ